MTSTTETSTSLSPLLVTCEKVWKRLQEYNSDIPDVVIVIGSGGRRASSLLGHFAKNSWGDVDEEIHEVLIVAESLNRGADEIFNTLIHEAVHGIAHVRGIKDVSNKRHNRRFAILAEELGLEPPLSPHPTLGFSDVKLSDGLKEFFAEEIGWIEDELKLCRKLNLKPKETKKTTWVANCQCDRKIRLPKKTISDPEELNIVCSDCGSEFTLPDEEKDAFVEAE
jgi:hypothetical protein